jgi:hypothetical protein
MKLAMFFYNFLHPIFSQVLKAGPSMSRKKEPLSFQLYKFPIFCILLIEIKIEISKTNQNIHESIYTLPAHSCTRRGHCSFSHTFSHL